MPAGVVVRLVENDLFKRVAGAVVLAQLRWPGLVAGYRGPKRSCYYLAEFPCAGAHCLQSAWFEIALIDKVEVIVGTVRVARIATPPCSERIPGVAVCGRRAHDTIVARNLMIGS